LKTFKEKILGLFSRKYNEDSASELRAILEECLHYTDLSEDSVWSCMDVSEIRFSLKKAIGRLENRKKVRLRSLSFLFLPTGPLQEVSISNGWAEEFLELAAKFDAVVLKLK